MHSTRQPTRRTLLLGLLLCVVLKPAVAAGWLPGLLIDPSDGRLDASKYLAETRGFLPVPILITEPSVGYGLGVAALFFHDPFAGKTEPGEEFEPNPERDGSLKPPSISALIAGATENDTWFVGGGHFGVWRDDTLRYAGLLMTATSLLLVGMSALAYAITRTGNLPGRVFRRRRDADGDQDC